MATFTTRLSATKPASSENVDISIINANSDLFDTAVGATVGTSAARPASAFQGRMYYATDSTKLYVNSAASASAAASWQDAVANALTGNVTIGNDLTMPSGAVNVTRSSSASNAFTADVSGDTQDRWKVTAGGVQNWSNGASTADTNLYRSAADTLKTDDSLIVGGTTTSVGAMSASTSLAVGTSLTVGNGLTVSAGKGQKTLVRKSATTGRASTTTLADDPHITFTLAASAVYQLDAYFTAAGAAAADIKIAWNATSGASGAGASHSRGCMGPALSVTDVTDTNVRFDRRNWNTSVSYGVDGTVTSHIHEEGLVDNSAGGAGSFTLQWAQNASNATSTTLSTGTYAILERLV
jgi:hypothetical protein